MMINYLTKALHEWIKNGDYEKVFISLEFF